MALSPVAWGSAWRLSGVAALGLAGIVTGQLASSESPSFEVQWNTPSASQEEAAEMVALDDPESMDSPDELAAPEETSAPMMAIMDAPEEASELSTPELSVELPIVQPNMEAEETINVLAIETAPAPTHTPVPEMDDASKEVNEVQPGAATETETDKVANEAKASEKAAAAAPVADRSLQLASINLKFQTRGRPVIGKSDAPVMFVELFDYTCQHCRKFNRQWQMVKQRFGDQVALMPLVVPLCLQCNPQVTSTAPGHENACEIGLIALAVWRLKPDQFEAFHDWLCEPESGRDLSEARSRANQIVGSELLSAELSGVMIGKHLSQHVELYRRLQKGTLPKLVSEQMTLTGVPESPESLCSQVEAVLVASRKN